MTIFGNGVIQLSSKYILMNNALKMVVLNFDSNYHFVGLNVN